MSPSGYASDPLQHAFQAPALESATVVDAMRLGVIACDPDTSLREVARIMATYRVHSVVITEVEGGQAWGMVTDLDVVAAAGQDLDKVTARDIQRGELVTIAADEPLARAAKQLASRGVAHLVVVQPHSGQPVGVLSTLDVAGVLAWGSDS
jgi:CBS domain-containing protein